MRTGEGKTLVAVLPSYLNALSGEGVQVICRSINEFNILCNLICMHCAVDNNTDGLDVCMRCMHHNRCAVISTALSISDAAGKRA